MRYIALALLAACSASVFADELWVVDSGTRTVVIVDTDTNLVSPPSIDLSDPDGDSTLDTPWGITFSTLNGEPGTKAFVTQGHLLTVIDVATRTVAGPPRDIGALTGVTGLDLRGCNASRPREFDAPVFASFIPVVQTYLHCAATSGAGDAVYVVLDQALLLAPGAGSPVVTWGLLATNASGLNVKVLDGPSGERFHRAWYTVTGTVPGLELRSILLSKGESFFAPWTVEAGPQIPLTSTVSPEVAQIGAPPSRPLTVMPGGASGQLRNLELGLRCELTGDFAAVSVTGPGPGSYTVFAADRSTDELVAVVPSDCAETRIAVGQDPVAVIPLNTVRWESVFVLNRGSGSVTRVNANDPSAPPLTISLGAGSQPSSGGMSLRPACHINYDGDTFDVGADVRVDWETAGICPASTTFDVYCTCFSVNPACDCYCDCEQPPEQWDPDCACAEFQANQGFAGMLDIALLPDSPIDATNPWKRLGIGIPVEQWDHENQADSPFMYGYGVMLSGAGPPP